MKLKSFCSWDLKVRTVSRISLAASFAAFMVFPAATRADSKHPQNMIGIPAIGASIPEPITTNPPESYAVPGRPSFTTDGQTIPFCAGGCCGMQAGCDGNNLFARMQSRAAFPGSRLGSLAPLPPSLFLPPGALPSNDAGSQAFFARHAMISYTAPLVSVPEPPEAWQLAAGLISLAMLAVWERMRILRQ